MLIEDAPENPFRFELLTTDEVLALRTAIHSRMRELHRGGRPTDQEEDSESQTLVGLINALNHELEERL
jgi:hypothetical protein